MHHASIDEVTEDPALPHVLSLSNSTSQLTLDQGVTLLLPVLKSGHMLNRF